MSLFSDTQKSNTLLSRTPDLHISDKAEMRRVLRDHFVSTFECYESLFETLANDDAFYEKAISLRHPLIFYYGHTATFFVNKLLLTRLIDERIDPHLESVFAVGVDEMSWDDVGGAEVKWPTAAEVKEYRDKVRAAVLNVIEHAPLELPVDWDNPWWAIVMGVEHERIHLETSSVLIRQHDLSRVRAHKDWQACNVTGAAPANDFVAVPEGKVILQKNKADAHYGWDNEYGLHEADVASFKASRYLVSNQEFLEFVEAHGYQTKEFWEEEGRDWQEYAQASHPTFWIHTDTGWRLRLMTEEVSMRWDWPVEVNYHEAKAFCNWKKKITGKSIRLPTEDEWYRLYDVSGVKEVGTKPEEANRHLDHYASSSPVNQFSHGNFFDVVGNVWQWTETPIYPFEGFDVHKIYDDFTTPTFDDRHNLIKGGSWISCGNETLRSARYAFRRHFFQHAGFRYVEAGDVQPIPTSHYETDKLLSEYAEFHYGDDYFGVENFSKALVKVAMSVMHDKPRSNALDIGCASGRASFELARHFDNVTGIDFSARFIGQGTQLAQTGSLRYAMVDEGELVTYKARQLVDLDLQAVSHKVNFWQGDACNLKPQFKQYDFILAANLIDRLYSPAKFLHSIRERLNIGGVLMIASPYTWLEEHTPKNEWLGGFKKDGENFTTFDGLNQVLSAHFKLLQPPQSVPFVIRETQRKFQHTFSEVTLWERVS